jgi:hypothetical protein
MKHQGGVQIFRASGFAHRTINGATCAVSAMLCSGMGCNAKNSLSMLRTRLWQRPQQVQTAYSTALTAHRIRDFPSELDQMP